MDELVFCHGLISGVLSRKGMTDRIPLIKWKVWMECDTGKWRVSNSIGGASLSVAHQYLVQAVRDCTQSVIESLESE